MTLLPAVALASASSSPWILRTSPLEIATSPAKVSKLYFSPLSSTSSCLRVVCRGESQPADLKFVLHHALDSSGIDTTHAREARKGFLSQIEKLTIIERETSISVNRRVDLGKTALYIAAEDDSLVSHSSVPLPVDSFIDRLYDLSMCFCSDCSSSLRSSPEKFLDSLEKYLYVKKGFRRSTGGNPLDTRALYLHSVLTHRSGSSAMLSLIYSEILKVLRLWSLLDFDCEVYFPHDRYGLPKGYHKQKSVESDQPHIMTTQTFLQEILRNLKETFWPFQNDPTKSSFLRAADAANCIDRSSTAEQSGFQLASAKAAQHRLDRGVWTSVGFGDMRRALSAGERLILLESDPKELRDYSILLYHCGFYEQSLQYLKFYMDKKSSSLQKQPTDKFSNMEEDAVEKLMTRLNLISMEDGWSKPSHVRNFLGNNSEPW
ncbi:hypothetical protein P3X46_011326 [Hevea brasiliensis]|uniref:Protein SirB1 N-terminal domain-containing protein n=1 Tax=Hevea brasiliensis TaxID=3981 RepID=A0ABQ9MGT8_HEVBR|nr:uncharacterized protein LOC110641876 isoform X1 [Hevea brasiliensis]KAJ9179551.1 hypothetical protein P3X46_011326 [Hevea brasiliensis]